MNIEGSYYLVTVVGPATKLHITFLVVEREPGDVNFASRLKDTWRDIQAIAIAAYNHVCWISSIKGFVSAASRKD